MVRFWLATVLLALVALPAPAVAESSRPNGRGSGSNTAALLVKFNAEVSAEAATATLAAVGATEIGRLDDLDTRVVDVPPGRRDAVKSELAANPGVASVEEDALAYQTLVPGDPGWLKEWGMRKIRAPEAWSMTTGAARTVIAVVDTGVDPRQPDLRGRVLRGWDFHNDDANAMDDNGHGTAVAGVAAAAGNDAVGIAGLCWRCSILPVKVLNANGSGTHSNIAAGVIWAADNGADVINLSLASARNTAIVSDAVAYARRKGVVVVAAAGNEGSTARYYPAALPGVLSVAGSSGTDVLYHWSNRGSWIKLAAPGCTHTGKPGPAWSLWCGTSFATPAVAGVAALVKSARPGLTRAEIERVLLSSTVSIPRVANGRIDAARALRKAVGLAPAPAPTPTPTPRATPTPTPRATPTPTPRATPTPTPRATPTPTPTPDRPSYDWSGNLSEDDHRDREWVWLSGETYLLVEWWGADELSIRVDDEEGDEVMSTWDDDGWRDEEFWVEPGWYEVTVSQWSEDWTEYRVRINRD